MCLILSLPLSKIFTIFFRGPLVFSYLLAERPLTLLSNVKLFADDLKLYLLIKPQSLHTVLEGISLVQRDIDSLINVAKSWDLKINATKTKLIWSFGPNLRQSLDLGPYSFYTVKGKPLTLSSTAVDLSITVDPSLRFHHHIQSIVSKAAGLSYSFIKSTLCCSSSFMVTLFITHVRPLLEFASPVWNTCCITDLSLLESAQRRWTKLITGCEEDKSYDQRLKTLDLYSAKGRLLHVYLIMCWKIFNGMSAITPTDLFIMAPARHTTRRHKYKIFVPPSTCEARHRFFSVRVVRLWNALPPEVTESTNINCFKKGLAVFLEDILFEFWTHYTLPFSPWLIAHFPVWSFLFFFAFCCYTLWKTGMLADVEFPSRETNQVSRTQPSVYTAILSSSVTLPLPLNILTLSFLYLFPRL